jgi:hypothetical protein
VLQDATIRYKRGEKNNCWSDHEFSRNEDRNRHQAVYGEAGFLQINHPRVARDPCPSSAEEGSLGMRKNSTLFCGMGALAGFSCYKMQRFDTEGVKKTFVGATMNTHEMKRGKDTKLYMGRPVFYRSTTPGSHATLAPPRPRRGAWGCEKTAPYFAG